MSNSTTCLKISVKESENGIGGWGTLTIKI